MLRSRMPLIIINDYEDSIKKVPGCPRMDKAETKITDFHGSIDNVKGHDVRFDATGNLDLPPPSGLTAVNYARFPIAKTTAINGSSLSHVLQEMTLVVAEISAMLLMVS